MPITMFIDRFLVKRIKIWLTVFRIGLAHENGLTGQLYDSINLNIDESWWIEKLGSEIHHSLF